MARAPITEVQKIQHNKFEHSAKLKSRLYTFKSYWKVSSLIDVIDNWEGCKFVFRLRPFHFSLRELLWFYFQVSNTQNRKYLSLQMTLLYQAINCIKITWMYSNITECIQTLLFPSIFYGDWPFSPQELIFNKTKWI